MRNNYNYISFIIVFLLNCLDCKSLDKDKIFVNRDFKIKNIQTYDLSKANKGEVTISCFKSNFKSGISIDFDTLNSNIITYNYGNTADYKYSFYKVDSYDSLTICMDNLLFSSGFYLLDDLIINAQTFEIQNISAKHSYIGEKKDTIYLKLIREEGAYSEVGHKNEIIKIKRNCITEYNVNEYLLNIPFKDISHGVMLLDTNYRIFRCDSIAQELMLKGGLNLPKLGISFFDKIYDLDKLGFSNPYYYYQVPIYHDSLFYFYGKEKNYDSLLLLKSKNLHNIKNQIKSIDKNGKIKLIYEDTTMCFFENCENYIENIRIVDNYLLVFEKRDKNCNILNNFALTMDSDLCLYNRYLFLIDLKTGEKIEITDFKLKYVDFEKYVRDKRKKENKIHKKIKNKNKHE